MSSAIQQTELITKYDTKSSKKKGYAKVGCGAAILIFIGILLVAYLINSIILPSFGISQPIRIRSNDLMDAVIVPTKDGDKIWIAADGSYNYTKKVSSPGRFSMGRDCIDCKLIMYQYDTSGNQLNKIEIPQNGIITSVNLDYFGGKVWMFIAGYEENEPQIEAFDPNSGKKILTTVDFQKKYTELSSGIAEMHYNKKEKFLNIKTKDARNLIFNLENETLKTADEYRLNKDEKVITKLALGYESSQPERMSLFKVTGPKSEIDYSNIQHLLHDPERLKFFCKAVAENLGNTYLNGIIYHRDDECVIIIHLDQIGKKANRIMTCVDAKTGKQIWQIVQFDKFRRMKIDVDKDPQSLFEFSKDKIGVERNGNFIILYSENEGVMVFDFKTGKKVSEIIL